tara:strand:- start:595 stop:783 length:189 start_codon:yes stop_codon:yes gene_type:complete
MDRYFIEFEQNGSVNDNGSIIEYSEGDILICDLHRMFFWVEHSKDDNVKILIYKGHIICNLS